MFVSGAHGYCYIFCLFSQYKTVSWKAEVRATHIFVIFYTAWLSPWVTDPLRSEEPLAVLPEDNDALLISILSLELQIKFPSPVSFSSKTTDSSASPVGEMLGFLLFLVWFALLK